MACKKTVDCGCGGNPLMTGTPCNETEECAKEPCSEVFCEECLAHCQPEISVSLGNGGSFIVKQGERLDSIIQRMMVQMANPNYLSKAAVGLRLLRKTNTTITLSWICATGATYTIEWAKGVNTYTEIIGSVTQHQLINLIPNTEYFIKLICNEDDAESVVMKIKTNI